MMKALDRIVTATCKTVLYAWLGFMCWLLAVGLWALAAAWWEALAA